MILHITNGDCAAVCIAQIQLGQRVLPWQDLLHEGPIPAGYDLRELGEIRARYLYEAGYADSYEEALGGFRSRQAALRLVPEFEEVALWFEHDLYDQLQLIQILSHLREHSPEARISLIQSGDYLGEMPVERLAEAWESRERVHRIHFDSAHMAWEAVRAAHPTSLGAMARSRFAGLPFLAAALLRFCDEYPSAHDGTSQTERIVLHLTSQGITEPGELFRAYQKLEEPLFLGDLSFFRIVGGLQTGAAPLLDADLRLTGKGLAVLEGRDDRIRGNGIDRWLGGVHLAGEDAPWRWDVSRWQFVLRHS